VLQPWHVVEQATRPCEQMLEQPEQRWLNKL
jgi:hypothetical protein